jgi:hypothetical protein
MGAARTTMTEIPHLRLSQRGMCGSVNWYRDTQNTPTLSRVPARYSGRTTTSIQEIEAIRVLSMSEPLQCNMTGLSKNGTITPLYEFDGTCEQRVLESPLREPQRRSGTSHGEFQGNLPIALCKINRRFLGAWW